MHAKTLKHKLFVTIYSGLIPLTQSHQGHKRYSQQRLALRELKMQCKCAAEILKSLCLRQNFTFRGTSFTFNFRQGEVALLVRQRTQSQIVHA